MTSNEQDQDRGKLPPGTGIAAAGIIIGAAGIIIGMLIVSAPDRPIQVERAVVTGGCAIDTIPAHSQVEVSLGPDGRCHVSSPAPIRR